MVLVPTMGALHAGHSTLLRAAREHAGSGVLAASIFVNPLQFGPDEDLARYPRSMSADLDLCAGAGVDVVFAPTVDEVYPDGEPLVTVEPGPLAGILEGAHRPGHFRGVLTVVAKLWGLVRPTVGVFGEKDYQQLVLVRRMSGDLCMGVEVVGVPTVREPRRPCALEPQPLSRARRAPHGLWRCPGPCDAPSGKGSEGADAAREARSRGAGRWSSYEVDYSRGAHTGPRDDRLRVRTAGPGTDPRGGPGGYHPTDRQPAADARSGVMCSAGRSPPPTSAQ